MVKGNSITKGSRGEPVLEIGDNHGGVDETKPRGRQFQAVSRQK